MIHEAPLTCGVGAEIAAQIAEKALFSLKAPPERVTGFDTIVPYAKLEKYYIPSEKRIIDAVHTSYGVCMKIFYLPDLGEGLAEAEIREWYVKEGDDVKVDQPLVSMETAKAVVDVPSPYAGKITELHGKANEIIKTGAPLITYETDEVQ